MSNNNHLSKKQIKQGKEVVEVFNELDHSVVNSEKFIEKYSKYIVGFFVVVLVVILGYFGYQKFVIEPQNNEAIKGYLQAQKNLSEGNEKLALGGKSVAHPGFLGTYQDNSGTKVGKLSAYNAGLIKFSQGKFQEAYDLIETFKSDNKILMAMKYGAMADCLVNLNKSGDAISYFDKAINESDDAFTKYYFTRKAGITAIGLKQNSQAKKYFNTIEEKYKDFDNGNSDAYIEMVKYY